MSSETEGVPLFRLLRGAAGATPDSMFLNLWIPIVGILLTLLLTAFFAAACTAVGALNEAQLKALAEHDPRRAARLQRLSDEKSRRTTLGAVGGGFAAVLGSALTALIFCPMMAAAAERAGWPRGGALLAGVLVPVLVYNALVLIFGVFFPARAAAQCAEKTAFRCAGMLRFFDVLLFPAVKLLGGAAHGLMRLCGMNPDASGEAVTEEDILSMVDAGEENGAIEESTKDMISNIFDFNDSTAGELMTHRTEVTAVEDTESVADVVKLALEEGYSRIPVYHDDIDDIRGILYVKDLLRFVGSPETAVPLTELMHDAYYVPEVKKCSELFTEMTEKKIQMAVVCDEYGGTSGIITMEDLIEAIVGNIQDEYDDEKEEISRLSENSFTVDGATALDEISELIGEELPEGDYDTIAGFLVDRLGRIPQEGEHPVVDYGSVTFTVQEVEDRRISQILIEKKQLSAENS